MSQIRNKVPFHNKMAPTLLPFDRKLDTTRKAEQCTVKRERS